jgi:hypothetical protein
LKEPPPLPRVQRPERVDCTAAGMQKCRGHGRTFARAAHGSHPSSCGARAVNGVHVSQSSITASMRVSKEAMTSHEESSTKGRMASMKSPHMRTPARHRACLVASLGAGSAYTAGSVLTGTWSVATNHTRVHSSYCYISACRAQRSIPQPSPIPLPPPPACHAYLTPQLPCPLPTPPPAAPPPAPLPPPACYPPISCPHVPRA